MTQQFKFSFIVLSLVFSFFILPACKKKAPFTIGIEPTPELGTIFFKLKPNKLANHQVIKLNKDLNIVLNAVRLDQFFGADSNIAARIKSISGKYHSSAGIEKLLVRIDGNFKNVAWDKLLKGKFKRSNMKGLKRGELFYREIKSDYPSLIISSDKIIIATTKYLLWAYKKLTAQNWQQEIDKQFSSSLLKKSIADSLFLISFIPASMPKKNTHDEMKDEFQGIPLYLPILSIKRLVFGLGESGKKLNYFAGIEFSDPQDIKDIKGMTAGLKSFFQLLTRTMTPIKKLIDETDVINDKQFIAIKGILTSQKLNNAVRYSKKKIKEYHQIRRKSWENKPNWENQKKEEEKLKKETQVLVKKIIRLFVETKYTDLKPLIAKRLRPRLDKYEFYRLAKKIIQLGQIKNIDVQYPYVFSRNKLTILTTGAKLMILNQAGEEKIYESSFEFVKENKTFKLLEFKIYQWNY